MVYEAGLISFLRTLLVIFIVFYGFRLLARYVFPWVLKYLIKKQTQSFAGQQTSQQTNRKEGEVRIKTKGKSRAESEKLGDYIDYEEVKD